jgi:hypothetical protein
MQTVGFYGAAQGFSRPEDMLLAAELSQRARAHAVRQGPGCGVAGLRKQVRRVNPHISPGEPEE